MSDPTAHLSPSSSSAVSTLFEHIHCCLCYRSYRPPSQVVSSSSIYVGEYAPFWITSCSHVVCEKELERAPTSDNLEFESCPYCHANHIKMIRLDEATMPESVKPFFMQIPDFWTKMLAAYKFQHEHMSHLINYLKSQTVKQKEVLKTVANELREIKDLKKENEALKQELANVTGRLKLAGNSKRPSSPFAFNIISENDSPRLRQASASSAGLSAPIKHRRLESTLQLPQGSSSPAIGPRLTPSRGGKAFPHVADQRSESLRIRQMQSGVQSPLFPLRRDSPGMTSQGQASTKHAHQQQNNYMGPPPMSNKQYIAQRLWQSNEQRANSSTANRQQRLSPFQQPSDSKRMTGALPFPRTSTSIQQSRGQHPHQSLLPASTMEAHHSNSGQRQSDYNYQMQSVSGSSRLSDNPSSLARNETDRMFSAGGPSSNNRPISSALDSFHYHPEPYPKGRSGTSTSRRYGYSRQR